MINNATQAEPFVEIVQDKNWKIENIQKKKRKLLIEAKRVVHRKLETLHLVVQPPQIESGSATSEYWRTCCVSRCVRSYLGEETWKQTDVRHQRMPQFFDTLILKYGELHVEKRSYKGIESAFSMVRLQVVKMSWTKEDMEEPLFFFDHTGKNKQDTLEYGFAGDLSTLLPGQPMGDLFHRFLRPS